MIPLLKGLASKLQIQILGIDMKVCNTCQVNKPLDDYHNCRAFADGKVYTCKPCAKSRALKWNKNNPSRKKALGQKHYKENKGDYFKRAVQRQKRVIQATPSWADLERIATIYEVCLKISEKTGVKHHVDHVVPLKGENVCGLHVEGNLAIIPAKMNLAKSNKHPYQY